MYYFLFATHLLILIKEQVLNKNMDHSIYGPKAAKLVHMLNLLKMLSTLKQSILCETNEDTTWHFVSLIKIPFREISFTTSSKDKIISLIPQLNPRLMV